MPAWNSDWYTKPIPSDAELERPDYEVDRLVHFIESTGRPGMARWAVETLSDSLGVPLVVLPYDPRKRIEELEGMLSIAYREAGRRQPWARGAVAGEQVAPFIKELRDLVREWRDEGGHMGRDWTGRNWA